MKHLITLLFVTGIVQAQDIIKTTYKANLNVKVLAVDQTIAYKTDVNSATIYYIAKSEVDEILYENGTSTKIDHPVLTLEEAKNNLITLINAYAYSTDSRDKLSATFEENKLKLSSESGATTRYNIAVVTRFDQISYRKDNLAFVNLWTVKDNRGNWEKTKLILKTQNFEQATLLLDAFIQLNKAFRREKS